MESVQSRVKSLFKNAALCYTEYALSIFTQAVLRIERNHQSRPACARFSGKRIEMENVYGNRYKKEAV
jgi:hypothetical protein